MKVFLAGGYSGNLRSYFRKIYADLFSGRASSQERKDCSRERESNMRTYLAGTATRPYVIQQGGQSSLNGVYILESFYSCQKNPHFPKLLPLMGDFLLDSGAFTFMSDKSKKLDWDKYTEEYAEFINAYNIAKFFELDIDSVVGLKEVERLRAKLERLTGKQSIPVWHFSRGKEYFARMVQEYKYVAFGGIITDGIAKQDCEKMFPYFIGTAHEHNCKIHGLGYTSCANLRKYHFDSVDSTTWLAGNRGGFLYKFNPNKNTFFEKIQVPQGKRLSSEKAAIHNFNEWVKFQQYANKNL